MQVIFILLLLLKHNSEKGVSYLIIIVFSFLNGYLGANIFLIRIFEQNYGFITYVEKYLKLIWLFELKKKSKRKTILYRLIYCYLCFEKYLDSIMY